jgi:hypothetical protein
MFHSTKEPKTVTCGDSKLTFMAATKSFTASILRKSGWYTEKELFTYLESVPESDFTSNGMRPKQTTIAIIRNRIDFIESEGEVVRGTREMTLPGNLFDSMSSDYQFIRYAYLQKRKKLKELLEKVKNLKP